MSCVASEHFASWFLEVLWRTRLVSQQPFLAALAMQGFASLPLPTQVTLMPSPQQLGLVLGVVLCWEGIQQVCSMACCAAPAVLLHVQTRRSVLLTQEGDAHTWED